jgi:hypothetical protein
MLPVTTVLLLGPVHHLTAARRWKNFLFLVGQSGRVQNEVLLLGLVGQIIVHLPLMSYDLRGNH